MGVEETLRSVGFTLVRFTSFASNALIFGIVPILALVVRPAFARLDAGSWGAGRRRVGLRLEGLVQAALVASLTATLLGLLLQVTLVSEFRDGDVDTPSFRAVIGTTFGQWYLLRLPLLAAAAVLLVGKVKEWSLAGTFSGDRPATSAWWAAWAGVGVALMATSTFSGHAAVAEPRLASIGNDIVHLISGATWFTGIVLLAVVIPDGWAGKSPADRLDLLAPAVLRFSRVALVAISVVGVTGVLNSFLHVGAWKDLVDTGYGRVLVVKIGLFLMILTLGGINHLFLRHRLQSALDARAATGAQPTFRKTIAAELVVAVSLMAVTGVLTGQARTRQAPPPPVDPVSSARP